MASWALKRQLTIATIILGLVAVLGLAGFFIFKPRPSCFDNKLNQHELEVDCGGECVRVCSSEVSPPQVLWSQVFPVGSGKYDVVALLDNKNTVFAVKRLPYLIRVYDENNILLTTLRGESYANPGEKFVVFVSSFTTVAQVPKRATLEPVEPEWVRLKPQTIKLLTSESRFTNEPTPDLEVAVRNDSLADYINVEVTAILSDTAGNSFAASKTVIELLPRGETRTAYFTWPEPFPAELAQPLVDIYSRINTITGNGR